MYGIETDVWGEFCQHSGGSFMRYLTDIRKLAAAALFTLIAGAVLFCAAPRTAHALTEEEALEVTSKGWHTLSTGNHVYMVTRTAPATGFQKIGGRYYYFDENGYLGLGWITVGDYRYFGQTSGALGKKLGMLKSGYVKAGGAYRLFIIYVTQNARMTQK